VPDDLIALAQPEFVLVAWAAGLALASGAVALTRLVGPGFTWMVISLAGLLSLSGAFGADTWWVRFGLIMVGLALVFARNHQLAGIFQLTAGFAYLTHAAAIGGWIPALTGTLAMGAVTSEMMLAHWYLVDPRLPRSILRVLASVGLAGLAADSGVVAVLGLPGGGATIAYWALMVASIVLMAAAIAALRQPAYSGVMAATGLSYLAVLTTLGGVFLGRVLVAGVGPFAN
jgi:hypothetical protein